MRMPYLFYDLKALMAVAQPQNEQTHDSRVQSISHLHLCITNWQAATATAASLTAELLATTGQTSMAELVRRHRVRQLGHADVSRMLPWSKQLLACTHIPGHPRPTGRPRLMWVTGGTASCMTWAAGAMH